MVTLKNVFCGVASEVVPGRTGCEQLILGSGQMGNVHLSPEAEAYFANKGCTVLLQPTPKAIHTFNSSHAKKIGLFHVTC